MTTKPERAAEVITALAGSALLTCATDSFDARAAMRALEGDPWPRFVNPEASVDFFPDRVNAEGLSAIQVLTGPKAPAGQVQVQISEGVHRQYGPERRFYGCTVGASMSANDAVALVQTTLGLRLKLTTSTAGGSTTTWMVLRGGPKPAAGQTKVTVRTLTPNWVWIRYNIEAAL